MKHTLLNYLVYVLKIENNASLMKSWPKKRNVKIEPLQPLLHKQLNEPPTPMHKTLSQRLWLE